MIGRSAYREKHGIPADAPVKSQQWWTVDEEDYLRANWARLPTKAICEHLGRPEASVAKKANRMKLGKRGWRERQQRPPKPRVAASPKPQASAIEAMTRARAEMKNALAFSF